ncbi:MAG: hypothetical protein ACRDEA_22735, partial [Microcystaceae cyanobacterium]
GETYGASDVDERFWVVKGDLPLRNSKPVIIQGFDLGGTDVVGDQIALDLTGVQRKDLKIQLGETTDSLGTHQGTMIGYQGRDLAFIEGYGPNKFTDTQFHFGLEGTIYDESLANGLNTLS